MANTLNRFLKPVSICFFILIICYWFFSWLFIEVFGLRINETESLPLGIYQLDKQQEIKVGDYVQFCLPIKEAQEAFLKGYIGKGSCYGKYESLAKEVIALPNDNVSINKDYIEVNKIKHTEYKQKEFDIKGRPATRVYINNQKIKGYVLVGSYNKVDSWDSRYFGVISKSNITGVLEPIYLF